ncbi:hypothetical protein A3A67_00770 [Candidatus Peribacteria bacterium RIFCSPLOWO2_01_FULL_51_18]|nr:hypothetical protein [Candidatus Woesearchaeota archaeon]OGJ65024.1 MAG: hypothetical protein A3A67_00770 [Candidatus Peribacteria bacterium RIFCSPLOWO2_01_FULL_51_18]HLD78938.1 hypothetical protein [Candidatus Nanoarchaeia archaeon]
MEKLIRYAVNLLERENSQNPSLMPSQNPELNPSQNPEINTTQNPTLSALQNASINRTQNPFGWRQEQWNLFKKTVLWDNLSENQKQMCRDYLKTL